MAKKRKAQAEPTSTGAGAGAGAESYKMEEIEKLIQPFTKEKLVELLKEIASTDSAALEKVKEAADKDVARRKIFVFNLGQEATKDALTSVFAKYGELEECEVIRDKSSGKSKGYGFVTFKTRADTEAALAEPEKKLNNRTFKCQLNADRQNPKEHQNPTNPKNPKPKNPNANANADGRKIYVAPVPAEIPAGRLKGFFSKFGEIHEGPIGFSKETGKSKGYALFVYKTKEGARRALEEPNKVLDGYSMNCSFASDGAAGKNKKNSDGAKGPDGEKSLLASFGLVGSGATTGLGGGLDASPYGGVPPDYGLSSLYSSYPSSGFGVGAVNPYLSSGAGAYGRVNPYLSGTGSYGLGSNPYLRY